MRVVVIGGGPAEVSAALHAAELGAEVTLIERRRQAAQMVVNQLGIRAMPKLWSSLNTTPSILE